MSKGIILLYFIISNMWKSTWETIYFFLIRIFSSNDKWITFAIRFLKENNKCQ